MKTDLAVIAFTVLQFLRRRLKVKKEQQIAPVYKPRAIEITCRGFGMDKRECLRKDACLRHTSFLLDASKDALDKKRIELIYCVSLLKTSECGMFVGELEEYGGGGVVSRIIRKLLILG